MITDRKVAGALYDFLGYLTSIESPIEVGNTVGVYDVMNAFEEWARSRDFNTADADVEDWYKQGSPAEMMISTALTVSRENYGAAGLPGGVRVDPESPNDYSLVPQYRL